MTAHQAEIVKSSSSLSAHSSTTNQQVYEAHVKMEAAPITIPDYQQFYKQPSDASSEVKPVKKKVSLKTANARGKGTGKERPEGRDSHPFNETHQNLNDFSATQ